MVGSFRSSGPAVKNLPLVSLALSGRMCVVVITTLVDVPVVVVVLIFFPF